ncbi:MAG: Nif3-like dinuclear metal center hexameric protein [Aeriscardovia sp.]|nr:Nif3-like dinuclear metal center hexameric protein [Aeriscardovia sp.]
MKLKKVVEGLEELYPLFLKEEWDFPGLVLGDEEKECKKIFFALDPTEKTAIEAKDWGADLMVTHHPLFFKAVHLIPSSNPHGRVASTLLSSGCALWVGHTNVDASFRGTNEALCARLGILDPEPMEPLGEISGHPVGMGRIGELKEAVSLEEFASFCQEKLPRAVQGSKMAGDPKMKVKRVAVMSGAGDSFLDKALELGADAFLTSDLRHHPSLDAIGKASALQRPMGLVDVSHFSSESPWFDFALQDVKNKLGGKVECRPSRICTDPWREIFI